MMRELTIQGPDGSIEWSLRYDPLSSSEVCITRVEDAPGLGDAGGRLSEVYLPADVLIAFVRVIEALR